MTDLLFRMKVRLTYVLRGNHTLAITAWDANHTDFQTGHQRIDVQARLYWTDSQTGKRRTKLIWKRGQTWCAVNSSTSIDGKAARELVLSLFAMKPGDTDAEYFQSWKRNQLDFAEVHGDAVQCELERRFGQS